MKLVVVNVLALVGVVALAVGIGYAPTLARWGAAGIASMWAAAVICLAAAGAAAVSLTLVALRWRSYVGQAALGGTVIRLLVTGLLAVGYQLWTPVHLRSFLLWLLVLYLLLLVVETVIGVVMVRTRWQISAPGGR
jgi:hypothetical protein